MTDHDQNFKNLILDYPREALEFFAEPESGSLDADVRILPVRQEQLKERLGERFRELDVPLLVGWPDGRREALLFVIEEESDTSRFSIHRLAHYCLDLGELLQTERVVPVVIFLRGGRRRRELNLGGDYHTYLRFRYLSCVLSELPYERYRDSDNIVARLNLPNMHFAPERRVEVYAQAVRGLATIETDTEKQLKYLDFVDIYADLDEAEQARYERDYPEEVATVTTLVSKLAERFIQQGMQQGMQQGVRQGMEQGMQQGEARVLIRLLTHKFGSLSAEQQKRITSADPERLLEWSERVLTAESLDEVLH